MRNMKKLLHLLQEDSSCTTDQAMYTRCYKCPELLVLLFKFFPHYSSIELGKLQETEAKS